MPKRRKILIDARMYGLEHAGIGRYLINLIKELTSLETEEQFIILLRKRYFNSLKLPSNWKKVLADFGHYTFDEQIKLPKIINEQKFDLVHFPHFNIPIFWRGKFVVTIHDMTMHKQKINATNLPIPIYFFKRIPYKYIFNKAVKDSVKIITPTESVKKELVSSFGIDEDKVAPIYEAFDAVYLGKTSKKSIRRSYGLENDYFVYTGNVYPHKNIKRAIEAVKYLNERVGKKVILAIAGSRDVFLQRLERDARGLEAEKYVKTLGFVPDDHLCSLYKNSVAFIYPSLSEGFGLQGLEAMASGTLLLASDIGVFKEVYKNSPLYFNPYDFSSIAKAMQDALEMKKEDRVRRIKKAQKFVKKYSWTKMAEETLRVYREALSK